MRVSLIGLLEQVNLSYVLKRIEGSAKTGLLKVKQREMCVELYFRRGKLMCIGPVRSNTSLGDRLLRAGVISEGALQEAMFVMDESQVGETRMALTLIDLGYVNHESLRAWAVEEASQVMQILRTWSTSEVYFEEEIQPPADRLLISQSATALLPPTSDAPALIPQPVGVGSVANASHELQNSVVPSRISDPPTLFVESQFLAEKTPPVLPRAFSGSESQVSKIDRITDSITPSTGSLTPPQRVTAPITPFRIDTSFMQPHMVLVPTDLSAQREQNAQVQLTPEQWRLFTRADGQTSLQMACNVLAMPRGQVCQGAGELLAMGLVTISPPVSAQVSELSPVSRDFLKAGLGNGYIVPGPAASLAQQLAAVMPVADNAGYFPVTAPLETHSQWGNGGNGATFVLGDGWVVSSSPSRALQPSGPLNLNNHSYAQMGESR